MTLKIVKKEVKEIIERYAKNKKMFVGYVSEIRGNALLSEQICVYEDKDEFKEDFEYYKLAFGNVATVTKYNDAYLFVNLNSNYYPKEVMRRLKHTYELSSVFSSYDQWFGTHWEFFFIVKNEDIEVFLNKLLELKEICSDEQK